MQPEQRGQGWQAWPQGGADTGTGWAEARGSGTVRYHVSHSCAWLAGLAGWGGGGEWDVDSSVVDQRE